MGISEMIDAEGLVEELLKGNMIAASRLISAVENSDQKEDIIHALNSFTGNAFVVGITGAPGVGKSTVTDGLIHYLRKAGKKIGIIAVDPTSPFSGGAILGDRIRLQRHSTDENVFIRSMASRGHLGGISTATSDAIKILDAYGCDYIFIETVGVGQSEIEIVKNVDLTLLVLIPGMGDDIQAIKAGIMEIADVFLVNKADKEGVDRIILEIEMLQNLSDEKLHIPIKKVIANKNVGISELVDLIQNKQNSLEKSGELQEIRKKRLKLELKQIFHNKLLQKAHKILDQDFDLDSLVEDVYQKKIDVYSVIDKVLQRSNI